MVDFSLKLGWKLSYVSKKNEQNGEQKWKKVNDVFIFIKERS